MDIKKKEVAKQTLKIMDTGREAIEYLAHLEHNQVDDSFAMALNVLEMLSEIQKALIIFNRETWWEEVANIIQSVISIFGELADSYEKQELESYAKKIDQIYYGYIELQESLREVLNIKL